MVDSRISDMDTRDPIDRASVRWRAHGQLDRAGCVLALLALMVVSFGLRTYHVHDQVFGGQEVSFAVADCWYHVRLVENLVHNFPRPMLFDPYGVFPDGQMVPVAPLFDWLLASACLVVGGREPTTLTIELVCAYAPAVLGALVVLPVYGLGRQLMNRSAGLLAASLVVIGPGQFLSRTLLGYTDHHAAEVLLSTTTVLFLVIALNQAWQPGGAVADRSFRGRGVFPLAMHGVLVGVLLGLYLLTWIGGALLVGILSTWLIVQFTTDHVARRATAYLPLIAIPALVTAALMVFPWGTQRPGFEYHRVALLGTIVLVLGLAGLSSLFRQARIARGLYPVAVLFGGVVVLFVASATFPGWTRSLISQVGRLGIGPDRSLIPEATPLLVVDGQWSLARAWDQFTTGFFLALPALAILGYRGLRRDEPGPLLVAVWSLAMLVVTLGQNRFAYYYAVNVALLTGYLAALVLNWPAGPNASTGDPARPAARRHVASGLTDPEREHEARPRLGWIARTRVIVTSLVIVLLCVCPNIQPAMKAAGRIATPHADWRAAMHWLRDNSPEPFGDPTAYYARFDPPGPEKEFTYPESAYGVMNSWGFGYWIVRMAHRIPVANPGQKGARNAARFFLAQDVDTANRMLDNLGARYVVIESTMPYLPAPDGDSVGGRLRSLSHWAGLPWETFTETWYRRGDGGQLQPVRVYYPAYYQTLLARLYVFRGQPCVPKQAYVMSFREITTANGEPIKELLAARRFESYEAALAFMRPQPPEQTRLVGVDPCESCVPLTPELGEYRLLYQSPTVRCTLRGDPVSHVEIYGYAVDTTAEGPAQPE